MRYKNKQIILVCFLFSKYGIIKIITFIFNNSKYIPIKHKIYSILVIILIILIVGIAITKLTVRDKVSVSKDFKKNVQQAININCDNPFECLALRLGQSRIISATPSSAEVESFTLFRIPLGFLRGVSNMKTSVFFNLSGDWSANNNIDPIVE